MEPTALSLADQSSGDRPLPLRLRRAEVGDVPAIVALMADDALRAPVESTDPADQDRYDRAFRAVDEDPAHVLVVMETDDRAVVGTMQLTFLPGLARAGATRMQIEAVRVCTSLRGQGAGTAMIRWAVSKAGRRGAGLVQLTSDVSRHDAHRFYERLGFVASHTGFKLVL